MDGILLDLRQKRSDEEHGTREQCNESNCCKISLNKWQATPPDLYVFTESQKMSLKCPDCGRSFSHSSSLKRHSRTHTGVRPFVCSICNKSFHYKNNLQDHCRTHTGEKPFKCPDCGQSFAQSSTLNRHIGTHSKDRTCHICGKAFVKLSLLERHFSTHVGIEEYNSLNVRNDSSHRKKVGDSCRQTKKPNVEHNKLPQDLSCSKCGLQFKTVTDFQHHLWCHVKEGQTFHELAALNGIFNMFDVLEHNASQSRG